MNSTVYIQKILIGVNVVQTIALSSSYMRSAFLNSFPVFEGMFKPELVNSCSISGCWQTIVPFLGSTYISIAIISLLALFFRAGKELRLILVGLALVHIFMATVRLSVIPNELYLEGVLLPASLYQYFFGAVLIISSALPYAKPS